MPLRRIVFLVLLGLFVLASGRGQSPNGTVSGIVTDPSGAAIVGAEILIVNDATRVQYQTKTNAEGMYLVPNLPPGTYRLQVSEIGFKTIIKPDIVIHVQDALAINFTLPIGAASEIVTVQGGSPLVNTENATVGTVVDRTFVENLPLNGRSFNTLLQLTPGVVIAPSSAASPGQFSVNGQRTNGNYFQVDGVSADFGIGQVIGGATNQGGGGGTQAFNVSGGTSSLVSVDALQEFRVETSSFAPEYGHTPGGQVMIETRSGTDAFHGGIFDYFRNTVLDANDWFNNATIDANTGKSIPRTPEQQNDFGGYLGGPIWKDKTFFFFSYEGLRLLQPQTTVVAVPSAFARSSAISAAAPYIDAYPQPNDRTITPGVYTAPFTGAYDNRISFNATSIRIDQILRNNWTLFGRFNYAPSHSIDRSGPLNEIDSTALDTTTLTIGITGNLAPNLTNSLRGNYSVQSGSQSAKLDSFGGATALSTGLLLPPPLALENNNAAFFISGTSGFYHIGEQYRISESQIDLVDSLTYSRGAHQFKFGVDYRVLGYHNSKVPASVAYESFDLQGFINTAQPTFFVYGSLAGAKIRLPDLGLYGQDAVKLGPRLTLTYGLRWEFNPTPSALDGTTLAAWNNTSSPQATALAPIGTPIWENTYTNFAPRVGIAYQLTSKGDFVVRAGWGIFYDLGTGLLTNLGVSYPNGAANFVEPSPTLPITNVSQYTPVPPSLQPPYPSSNFLAFARDLKSPRSYQWNVAVEKSFRGEQSLSLTYVGQLGRNLLRSELESQPNARFLPGSLFQLTLNGDTSDYSALQIQYRRPLSQNLQALLNYTWSHCIDTNSADSLPVGPSAALPAQGDRGNCDFDVRDNFTGAITYNLPQFTRRPFLAQLVNNWSVDAVVQARSGFPITVTYTDFSFPGIDYPVPLRPDLVSGQSIWLSGSQCMQTYGSPCPGGKGLNFNAFDSTTPMNANRQGTLGRNAIAGFGATQVDVSIMRKFPITERINLQFRADVFNILNHPNFFNPDSSLDDGPSAPFGLAQQMLNNGLGGLNALYQLGGPRSIQFSLKLTY